jgi:hypothetical protein
VQRRRSSPTTAAPSFPPCLYPSCLYTQGTEQLRRRYTEKFRSPGLRSVLHGRLVLGDTVVDRETVYGLPGGASDALGIYTVNRDGKIARMVFKFQPVEQAE